MSIKIAQSPTFLVGITANIPNDRGTMDANKFDLRFKRERQDELESEIKNVGDDVMLREFVAARIVGWKGVQDADGKDLEFTQDGLTELLAITGVSNSVFNAWQAACKGTKAKN